MNPPVRSVRNFVTSSLIHKFKRSSYLVLQCFKVIRENKVLVQDPESEGEALNLSDVEAKIPIYDLHVAVGACLESWKMVRQAHVQNTKRMYLLLLSCGMNTTHGMCLFLVKRFVKCNRLIELITLTDGNHKDFSTSVFVEVFSMFSKVTP